MTDRETMAYVLVMHGAPPSDFPPNELREFFQLHTLAEVGRDELPPQLKSRLEELGARLRDWPRTPTNDPFHAASYALADAIQKESGRPVHVGFNEFCDPDVEAAVEEAIVAGAARVIVLTPMLTRGGAHAESDIPRALGSVRLHHPHVVVEYAWPFPVDSIARFLLHAGGEALGGRN